MMLGEVEAFGGFSVDDIESARAFYDGVLGIPCEVGEMGTAMLQLAGGARPTLIYAKGEAHVPASFTVLNFPVNDVAGAVAALRGRGVVFERYEGSPVETDEDFVMRRGGPEIAWFKDPAGNVLSIIAR